MYLTGTLPYLTALLQQKLILKQPFLPASSTSASGVKRPFAIILCQVYPKSFSRSELIKRVMWLVEGGSKWVAVPACHQVHLSEL